MAASLSAMQPEPPGPDLLPRILAEILSRFERNLYRLAEDDPDLAREWDRLNLLRDQAVRVALGPRILEGKVRAIDAEGALCLDDGLQLHRLFGGQVLRDRANGHGRVPGTVTGDPAERSRAGSPVIRTPLSESASDTMVAEADRVLRLFASDVST